MATSIAVNLTAFFKRLSQAKLCPTFRARQAVDP
jgi:hypothetical protein